MTLADDQADYFTPVDGFDQVNRFNLDDRELRILAGFSNGETVAVIARSIDASPGYTSKLASVLYLKLGAVDKAHAVAIAYDHGILEPRGGEA